MRSRGASLRSMGGGETGVPIQMSEASRSFTPYHGKKRRGHRGMPKRATNVIVSEQEQAALVQVTKRHRSEQHQVLRARIVLAAAQGRSNVQIARDLAIPVDTVRLWRDRWAGLAGIDQETLSAAERLQDAPRPG